MGLEKKIGEQLEFEFNYGDTSQPSLFSEKTYSVPGMTEDPAVSYGMTKRWIIEFHELNGMDLPTGFHSRNKKQLLGMYYGMLVSYNIGVEDIVVQNDY